MKSEYPGCFRMGVFSCPIARNPGPTHETLENRYEEPMARLQKIKNAGYTVPSVSGV